LVTEFVPVGSAPGFQAREFFRAILKIKFPFYSPYGKNIFGFPTSGKSNCTYTKAKALFQATGDGENEWPMKDRKKSGR
jgi:hypothetical protein